MGNIRKKVHISSGVTWTYVYDHVNHLIEAKQSALDPDYYNPTADLLLEADYKYDALGNRIQKDVDWDGQESEPAEVFKYAIDGWDPAKPAPIGNENYDVLFDATISSRATCAATWWTSCSPALMAAKMRTGTSPFTVSGDCSAAGR